MNTEDSGVSYMEKFPLHIPVKNQKKLEKT